MTTRSSIFMAAVGWAVLVVGCGGDTERRADTPGDAGQESDAGQVPDAGHEPDAGPLADSGTPENPGPTVGVSCSPGGGCSEFIGSGSGYIWVDGTKAAPDRYAGKTLCIRPGTYEYLALHGVKGTAEKPVTITNCDGQAVFNNTKSSPVGITGASRYLRLTGTGSTNLYGLVAGTAGGNQAHIDLREGTSDVEIDHVEVRGNPQGGVGIAFRTYPTCAGVWARGTWAQYNTRIHDTYVHDTVYEGLYIGPSHHGWESGLSYTPGVDCGGGKRVFEADVIGVEVVDNQVENTGNDAIQVGGALQGMTIRGNVIRNYGLNNNSSHSGGITVNPGSMGVIDANWIETAQPRSTQGILFQGLGGTLMMNNVILGANTGTLFNRTTDVNLQRASPPPVAYHHNTVVSSATEGIYVFCNLIKDNTVTFSNNVVAGAPVTHAGNGNNTACLSLFATTNLVSTQVAAAGFVDAAAKNFHLRPSSPAVDKGVNLAGVVDFDYDGAQRVPPHDQGAYVAAAGLPFAPARPEPAR
ncbi:right-handed parallel beta-helix repeat-containing protein [Myxococcus sp. K15C18031901]|uniref:right-handed parallel beta-helix repeat-containing protein n=1 Tax=Myxococcus dinghuensis TaxID=2906761 RepID=UPI0020A72675|nr:right-handed parallel beta-helix repeat-containing protein [Myxococcus dinghuensis]MCP3097824.1 right-handed parallel beta-helix repeat-containing protein [Myxococcus dinghuensis]